MNRVTIHTIVILFLFIVSFMFFYFNQSFVETSDAHGSVLWSRIPEAVGLRPGSVRRSSGVKQTAKSFVRVCSLCNP